MYIDSHAHLFVEDYGTELPDVIRRAQDAGVERIVVPGTNERTSKEALELAEKYEFIYACVGLHPHEAAKATDALLAEIESFTTYRKVVGIGEIGLDYHYDFSPREQQIAVFRQQIELAIRTQLPIVVHTRESYPDTVQVIDECLAKWPQWKNGRRTGDTAIASARGVFHCFTGSAAEASHLFERGFYVSYPGIVTFKNSTAVETLKHIGFENILLETDSPYLAPVPLRGTRNEPAHVALIARKISEILEVSESNVATVTSLNSKNLFRLESPD